MKESYGEGLATHTDPEACDVVRKGGVEALTGARAGRVLSREIGYLREADAVRRSGRSHRMRRQRETCLAPARSETPCTHGYTSHENRDVPWVPAAMAAGGRVGKSIDVRRR
jgi:RNA-directed DNA polymerase